ncbi:hypothetical protein SSX86_000502 [Deinandra increscens subsp. villosa]|uniref:Uncharacterized protein n=1 Tax=Deinandra increscens subsp. villosa TaxID=3103831 RepID=A0AAP0HBM4_9ASTR
MDRTAEEDMKLVGFFGIFTHSFKTIFSSKKILSQITLTFILPLTIIFVAHMQISHHFFSNIEDRYLPYDSSDRNTSSLSGWLYYWLFKILYFTFLTLFSLLSTAAVVFTVASAYADRDVIFRQVLKTVPNVWKKLCVTFIFIYFALFIYNVLNGVVLAIVRSIFGNSIFSLILLFIILILYVLGLLYLTVIWQLASVVTVLENVYGFKALKKGKDLINGKKAVGMGIVFVLYGILLGFVISYALFVEFGGEIGLLMIWRVMIGILLGILVTMLFLLIIVAQTVLYLVCKSHHREAIDKVSLSTFLSVYTAETVVFPKPGEEIQLGRTQPPPPPVQQV